MTLLVQFRGTARAELITAATRYEALRPNLGVEFVKEIDRCVALAVEHPVLFGAVHSRSTI